MADKYPSVDGLLCDAVGVRPVNYDWRDNWDDGDGWEAIRPDADNLTLEQCKAILDDAGRGISSDLVNPWDMDKDYLRDELKSCGDDADEVDKIDDIEWLREAMASYINDETCDGIDAWRDAVRELFDDEPDRFEPMINYYYPLPDYDERRSGRDALALDQNVPLTLVRIGDEYALALTGGGMDLSWQICEAYMIVGYLPPLHFANLPHYSGLTLDGKTKWVIDGCVRAAEVLGQQAAAQKQRLKQLAKSIKKAKATK